MQRNVFANGSLESVGAIIDRPRALTERPYIHRMQNFTKKQGLLQNHAADPYSVKKIYYVFLINFSLHRGQVMEILPFPRGTRTIWRHLGQSK